MGPQTLILFRQIWTGIGAVGVACGVYTTTEAHRDRAAAIRRRIAAAPWHARPYLFCRVYWRVSVRDSQSWTTLRNNFVGIIVQATFCGVRLMSVGWPPPRDPAMLWPHAVYGWALTGAQILYTIDGLLDLRDRKRQNTTIRKRRNDRTATHDDFGDPDQPGVMGATADGPRR